MPKKLSKEEKEKRALAQKEKREFIKFGAHFKTPSETVSSDLEFIQCLQDESFHGIQIFGNETALRQWMERWHNFLLQIGGKFFVPQKKWTFPNGAVLDLVFISSVHGDYQKLAGMSFNWLEVHGEIDPELQKYVMTRMYEKLTGKK